MLLPDKTSADRANYSPLPAFSRLVITRSRAAALALCVAALGLVMPLGISGMLLAGVASADPAAGTTQPQAQPAGADPGNPQCDPNWQVVSSPNEARESTLNAVAGASASDVWAVGWYHNGTAYQTLIEHWNGTAWNVFASPNVNANIHYLKGVAAVSANDAWAVGYYYSGATAKTLIERWNGTSWGIIPSPNTGTSHNYLQSVAVVSANDVWAAGYYFNGTVNQTLILRWNGSVWNVVTSPNTGTNNNQLTGVTVVSTSDVWAVGYYFNGTTNQTLTMRWNGSAWSVVVSPNGGTSTNFLWGVTAASANDVWAVGDYINGMVYQTLTLHWTGSVWSLVSSPNIGMSDNNLLGVKATSANNVWAVGQYVTGGNYLTLVELWNGSAWSVVSSPNADENINSFRGVLALSATDVWAVGFSSSPALTLAEHWNGSAWSVVPSPNAGTANENYLVSVDAQSANDVWAVGSSLSNGGGVDRTLIERWNGSAWNVVTSPNVGTNNNYLEGVAVVAANDVWAVGSYSNGTANQTLILHWNGATWGTVVSPNFGTLDNHLNGVAAVSATDVWAVGYYFDGSFDRTLIEHWNGSTWSVLPSPNPGGDNVLWGVAAVSANDVWAVGAYEPGGNYLTLAEHWNGSAWNVVLSPNPSTINHYLKGVAAVSANDVWAVGDYYSFLTGNYQTLVELWNGSAWSVVSSPNTGTNNNYLNGVAVGAANDVWAVGEYYTGTVYQTLILHWNGATWGTVASPNFGTLDNHLNGVAAVSATDVWAVGYVHFANNPAQHHTLVERYNPCEPTPLPTQTPGGPTATPEATQCPIQFTDVPPGSTFYDFVRCMACRGIINGYASGCKTGNPCFRPNSNVTRGQLSKIVSNAAGYSESHVNQSFEDVAVGSTFYQFVERLFSRGYISGYACGGQGEPCIAPDNRPYFRPNGTATRGQTSKIVASARGLPAPPSSQQTFQDVVEGSTFWQWIEALATNGAISGYPCGNPEPCVPPQNRPYFRPNNQVTRGQSAKIVANAFFPNCQTPGGVTK